MKPKKELFISPSLFTLFVFMLINKDWDKADYLLQDRIPPLIIKNLRRMGLKVTYIKSGESIGSGNVARFLRILVINAGYIKFLLTFKGKDQYSEVFGNDEMVQALPFRKQGITLIEDGSFNLQSKEFFQSRVKKMHRFLVTRLFNAKSVYAYTPYGYQNSVKKVIYLTHQKSINEVIDPKVEFSPLKELWESKTPDEKVAIQSVFGMTSEIINSLNNYPNVLLTQPLGKKEGGFMSEADKVKIYSDLLKDTPQDKLLIKTHYAEKINYRTYFKDALVIDQPIPFQFFELFNYKPSKVITISSTAALKYKNEDCEIVFAGTEIDDRIVKMYGVVRL